MKVQYTSKNNRLNVEIQSESVKDTFKKLAEFQEVFDEQNCGICKNDNIQFIVRTVENNDYFELKCRSCNAKLAFGQHRSGGSLFPKRKLANGSYDYQTKGWFKWNSPNNVVQQTTTTIKQANTAAQKLESSSTAPSPKVAKTAQNTATTQTAKATVAPKELAA